MRKAGRRLRMVLSTALVAGMAVIVNPTQVAYAATIAVTTTADELDTNGACSLREAVRAANLNTGVGACAAGSATSLDTITVPAGTYVLTRTGADEEEGATGDLDVTGTLKITGAGAATTIIDGNALDRVINVKKGAKLTLETATIQNGQVGGVSTTEDGGGIYNGATLTLTNAVVRGNQAYSLGGGIYNNGTLTLNSTIVSDNYTDNLGGGIYNAASRSAAIIKSTVSNNGVLSEGGGIQNFGTMKMTSSMVSSNNAQHYGGGISNKGTLQLVTSTINGNVAPDGNAGGLLNSSEGTATLTNSTVSGNISWNEDGYDAGGIHNGGTMTLYNSTVTSNKGWTGGINNGVSSSATIINTIVAGNTDPFDAPQDCRGTVTSQGYNLISNTRDCTISGDTTGNLVNVGANLGPLQINSGPTLTHALQPGSPAIDAGNPATPGSTATACAKTDQRAVTRPADGNGDGVKRCDIGAVERKSASAP